LCVADISDPPVSLAPAALPHTGQQPAASIVPAASISAAPLPARVVQVVQAIQICRSRGEGFPRTGQRPQEASIALLAPFRRPSSRAAQQQQQQRGEYPVSAGSSKRSRSNSFSDDSTSADDTSPSPTTRYQDPSPRSAAVLSFDPYETEQGRQQEISMIERRIPQLQARLHVLYSESMIYQQQRLQQLQIQPSSAASFPPASPLVGIEPVSLLRMGA
jgi:hypothetical protein